MVQRRPIRSKGLLEQADELAGREQGSAGRPRNAGLRRAVSAAYYALYHEITQAVAVQLAPNGHREDRWVLTRGISHTAVLDVCKWALSSHGGPERVARPMTKVRGHQGIRDIATAFVDLQAARHEADYDHLADFSKATVLSQIDASRDAIRVLIFSEEDPELELFLALVALHSRTT